MKDKILLGHGSGGKLSHELINNLFVRYFNNPVLNSQTDSAVLETGKDILAFTTDSFVVDPIFFPGGDIGKLAVAGTVNDLAVSGAEVKYMSCSFIIEEGFRLNDLEKIVESMTNEAAGAGIEIVTGDTKVVDRGKCDKLFINTTGIGTVKNKHRDISYGTKIKTGDKIIINGTIADHGMSILSKRNEMKLEAEIESDCACLNSMIKNLLDNNIEIKFMRDATRGGIATVVAELVEGKNFGINLNESEIKIRDNVRGMCEILGFDPLYVANEGKALIIVSEEDKNKTLDLLRKNKYGKEATVIGEITDEHHGKAWLTTDIGGRRIIDMLAGEQLPRIC